MTEQRVLDYLEALKTADPQAFSRPPGLGNVWRNKHVRAGLGRRVIVIHHSGQGLAFQYPANHRCCDDCSRTRGAHCTHCNCTLCAFEREAAETDSRPITREKFLQLVARLKAFEIRPVSKAVSLLD